MELNLTTFILEVVNFLVLIWILKRLFFAPIKKAIETRRTEIKKSLDDAEGTRAAALKLREQYENRLKDWEREKTAKVEDLKKELDLERDTRVKEIGVEVVKERERLKAQEEKAKKEIIERQERDAISQSLAFLSKLLAGIASKDVEASIIRVFLEKLKNETETQKLLFRDHDGKASRLVSVRSAFPMTDDEHSSLLKGLSTVLKDSPQTTFDVDHSLIAGVEVSVGSVVLRANLRDELKYFSMVNHDGI